MSLHQLMYGTMMQWSHGDPVYLRVRTTTGGNPALKIPGATTVRDYRVPVRPKIQTITMDNALTGAARVTEYIVVLLFDSTITQSLFGTASGLIVGGTFNESTNQVTGGRELNIVPSSITRLYLGSSTCTGVEFRCVGA